MTKSSNIIIACLPVDPTDLDAFSRSTARLDAALSRLPAQRRACLQDGDDLTFFDHDSIRVGLSWLKLSDKAYLILALGAHPDILPFDPTEAIKDVFAKALVRMVAPFADDDVILWQSARGALVSDILDNVAADLEDAGDAPAFATSNLQPALLTGPAAANTDAAISHLKNKQDRARALPRSDQDVLAELRAVVYQTNAPQPSMQMKLSAYALSTAFVFVTPSVGLAMLTYAVLRHGEDLMTA